MAVIGDMMLTVEGWMWAADMLGMGKRLGIGTGAIRILYQSVHLALGPEGSLPFIFQTWKYRRMKGINHPLILSNPSFDKG